MLKSLKKLLGIGPSLDFKTILKNGAIVLDVRSKEEYESGHIKGSINIPLEQLENNLQKLQDKKKAIITCCASGMRSSAAKGVLKVNGYMEVYNGGGWQSLQKKLD